MEIRPELKNTIRNFCSFIMSGNEAEQFANLDKAIELIKQGQPRWQAPVSIGVHTCILHWAVETDATDAEDAILKHLITHAIEPLEAQLESLVPKSSGDTLENEMARLLFHIRFGLGFLLLANGDEERAKTVLHEMAATPLSVRGNEYRGGHGIVKETPDMVWGKYLTALLMQIEYEAQEDYGEALYLVTEAIACSSNRPIKTMLFESAYELLDLWATKCNDEDATKESDFISWNWVDLFGEAAEILSLCQDDDSPGALPNDCGVDSAQFLAWKFGQIAGRLAIHDQWRENPFEMTHELLRDRGAFYSYPPEREVERVFQALTTVSSLICEYDIGRDWEKERKHYISMWEGSNTYQGTALSELSPESDLYWAMRIGFADTMLEASKQQALIPLQSNGQQISSPIARIEAILLDIKKNTSATKDIASTIAIRQIKFKIDDDRQRQQISERLPLTPEEIRQFLEKSLGKVWRVLPSKIVSRLREAEKDFDSEDTDDARVGFNRAVEASLNYCLVTPLVKSRKERGYKKLTLCFPPPRGKVSKNVDWLGDLSLKDWGDILEMLPNTKGSSVPGTQDLRDFLMDHLGIQDLPDFRPLSRSLKKVWGYRGGSAHDREVTAKSDWEKHQLDQMRNLVLGIEETSVIAQIFELLAPQEPRKEL